MGKRYTKTGLRALAFALFSGAAWAFAAVGPGCADQSFVTYVGTVTESDEAGYSFDPEPPQDGVPVLDASIALCPESKCRAVSNQDGFWGPAWQTFPLMSHRTINLRVEAEGFVPFTYETQYPDTSDPVTGDVLLNVRLQRASDVKAP